jgi:hypothetical protein
MLIAFSLAIDATILVKAFGVNHSSNFIVGGAAPNHNINIHAFNSDGIKEFLRECIVGKRGDLASKIKVAVVSIQNTPPGMSTYFVLCGKLTNN